MALIIMLQDSAWRRDRIAAALALERTGGAVHTLRSVRGWADVFRLAETEAPAVVIADPYRGGVGLESIKRFLQRFPMVSVVAYGAFADRPAREIADLTRVGVRDLVTSGLDDEPIRLQHVIASNLNARASGIVREAFGRVSKGIEDSSVIAELLRVAYERSVQPLSPGALAEALGLSRSTLERRLRKAGLPTPERLITRMRVLHAARLLQDPHRSFASVAQALRFTSASALRVTLKRHSGLEPSDLRRPGAIRTLAPHLLRTNVPHLCRRPGP